MDAASDMLLNDHEGSLPPNARPGDGGATLTCGGRGEAQPGSGAAILTEETSEETLGIGTVTDPGQLVGGERVPLTGRMGLTALLWAL
mmetsp:Transcript_14245/g.39033  ORF Transcript_14245/g.39033 Transcript_14245/m.39033 type:complete len:88 (-) Transcript_14245:196-459(-)